MANKVDAYLSGYEEACQGGEFESNPYRSDNSGDLWAKWRQGFSDALQNRSPRHKKPKWLVSEFI